MKKHQIKLLNLHKRVYMLQGRVNRMSLFLRCCLKDIASHVLLIIPLKEHANQALALKPIIGEGKGKEVDVSKEEEEIPLHPQILLIPMN